MTEQQIKFKCKGCGKALSVRKEFQGKKGKCPNCGAMNIVPSLSKDDIDPDITSFQDLQVKSKSTATPDLSGKKVLVIDDDRIFLKIMTKHLHPTGCEVIVAMDGIVATMALTKQKPDLILLDLGLPGGGGFVLLDRWSKSPSFIPPIIVVTAEEPAEAKDKALEAGAASFIYKPDMATRLFPAIHEVLSDTI